MHCLTRHPLPQRPDSRMAEPTPPASAGPAQWASRKLRPSQSAPSDALGLGVPNLDVPVTSMFGASLHGKKQPSAKVWQSDLEAPSRWRSKLPAERCGPRSRRCALRGQSVRPELRSTATALFMLGRPLPHQARGGGRATLWKATHRASALSVAAWPFGVHVSRREICGGDPATTSAAAQPVHR